MWSIVYRSLFGTEDSQEERSTLESIHLLPMAQRERERGGGGNKRFENMGYRKSKEVASKETKEEQTMKMLAFGNSFLWQQNETPPPLYLRLHPSLSLLS